MIVDTSVLVAIFSDEPERHDFALSLGRSSSNSISAGSWVELSTVLVRKFGIAKPASIMAEMKTLFRLEVEPVTATQATVAVAAYEQFGRGTGHAARLNFGDCFAYALANDRNEPLLFKGDDFTHTDIVPAVSH